MPPFDRPLPVKSDKIRFILVKRPGRTKSDSFIERGRWDKIRFIAQGRDDIPSTSPTHHSAMPQQPKSSRLVARFSVRLRREGGSLSATIPRYIVRHWKLEAGMRLVVRSTDRGILLFPRYFLPYSSRRAHRPATQPRDEEPGPAGLAIAAIPHK